MNKNAPFISAGIFLLAVIAVLEYVTLKKTNGVFCYPLDDTFIHMAVAKNAALFGTWGVSADNWVSTSSSPLFTGLLTAMYKLFGLSVYFPFLLGITGAFLLIWVMQRELNRHTSLSVVNKSLCIIITLFAGAIPSLAALGMEHTFQIAFTLGFVHSSAALLTGENNSTRQILFAAAWGACMVFTRYENAFVVASVCGLLFLQKRFKASIIIGALSALPIALFGLYAVSKGGLFIPNSIQIKVRDNYKFLLNGGLAMLEVAASISGLLVLAIFVLLRKFPRHQHERSFQVLAVFVLSGLLHSVFGGFGWFYRYEAYLIVLGSFHLLILFFQWFESREWARNKQYLLFAAVAILLTFNLPLRGVNAMRNFVRSTYNIYEQQYQMGTFIKKYYNNQTIAANDIGAISYLADIKTIDLWGLGNNEVTIARKGGYWNPAFLQTLVTKNNTSIAVVYESWFPRELTANWKKVGTWNVSYSFMLGDTKVSFYAINPKDVEPLRRHLSEFNAGLPADIQVEVF
ncbi:MAG TPA: hypothetical protein VEZ17_17785 [Chitinophagaceae bacterium]|jgi:hypothetical protein|nr:hypothetical protein [Chitinophagaceae bacterium]